MRSGPFTQGKYWDRGESYGRLSRHAWLRTGEHNFCVVNVRKVDLQFVGKFAAQG
jgi:hypothetical protein